MRISSTSPFRNKNLKIIAGSACFAEVAISHGNTWNTNTLELITNKDNPGDITNNFNRMYNGSIPDNTSCYKYGLENIKFWRDNPLWPLLCDHINSIDHIDAALKSVTGNIINEIWIDAPLYDNLNGLSRYVLSNDDFKSVASYNNFNALIILSALAKEAKMNRNIQAHAQSSLQAYTIFPHVICTTPHLFIRWPYLLEQYNETLWIHSNPEVNYPWYNLGIEKVIEEIWKKEANLRQHNTNLPPESIMKRLNKGHPFFELYLSVKGS